MWEPDQDAAGGGGTVGIARVLVVHHRVRLRGHRVVQVQAIVLLPDGTTSGIHRRPCKSEARTQTTAEPTRGVVVVPVATGAPVQVAGFSLLTEIHRIF